MKLLPFAVMAPLVLAACDATRASDAPPPPEDTCSAELIAPLIGQPQTALSAIILPIGTRIFRTGDALTMDFSPTRLNIEIDAGGTILAATCG